MPLDNQDRCGIGLLSLSKDYWLNGQCKWHDLRFVSQDRSFIETTKEWWSFINVRREQLGRSRLEAGLIWATGTFFGAPIWFGRSVYRALRGG